MYLRFLEVQFRLFQRLSPFSLHHPAQGSTPDAPLHGPGIDNPALIRGTGFLLAAHIPGAPAKTPCKAV
jgi:hypothetical protein